MSLFSILGTGRSGLAAAQAALDVTAQNVANANTPGYSRQRVDQTSLQSTPYPGLYTGYATTLSGASVSEVERVKNTFLQAAASNAVGKQSALQGQIDPLNNVQASLSEPGDNGFQETLDNFYASWQDLANDPSTTTTSAAGTQVLGAASAVSNQLNTLASNLSDNWKNQLGNLNGDVDQANADAAKVAQLNAQIVQGNIGGLNVNDLMDERDRAVTDLSKLVGGVPLSGVDGQVSVSVGGVALVSGSFSTTLSVAGGGDITVAESNPPALMIGNVQAIPALGAAAGILSSLRTDLPAISDKLDAVADTLSTAVNGLLTSGYTIAGDPGTALFSGTGAAGISVALTTPDQLAVSTVPGAVDGSNALNIANLANDAAASAALGGAPGPSAIYRSMTTGIGTQVQGLNTALVSQTAIVTSTQGAVDSDSGVSLDEELTNMLLYQHAYEASAKVVTTADQMLQTLIGMV